MFKFLGKIKKYINLSNIAIGSFIISILLILFFINHFGMLKRLELLVYDVKIVLVTKNDKTLKPSKDIVILSLDDWTNDELDKTNLDFNRWPWPRYVLAQAIEYVNEAKPKAILYHIRYDINQGPELDKDILKAISRSKNFYGVMTASSFKYFDMKNIENKILNKELDPKKYLKINEEKYNLLLKQGGLDNIVRIIYENGVNSLKTSDSVALNPKFYYDVDTSNVKEKSLLLDSISFITHSNIPESFEEVYKRISIVMYPQDEDYVLRSDRPLFRFIKDNRFLPSLAFSPIIDIYGKGKAKLYPDRIEVGEKVIPIDKNGKFMINFRYNFENYKVIPILKAILSYRYEKGLIPEKNFDKKKYYLDKNELKDKFVIIGTQHVDEDSKSYVIPGRNYSCHLQMVANELDNYLNCGKDKYEKFIKPFPPLLTVIIVILFCVLTSLLIIKFENILVKFALIFIGTLLYILFSMSVFVLPYLRLNIPVVIPVLLILLTSLVTFFWQYNTVFKKRQEIDGLFGKFISPQVKKVLLEDPTLVNYEGQKKEMTVLFSDLRGFTTIMETMPAHKAIAQLNEYFDAMANIIVNEYNGTLDKYMGDAVMAFWGDPLPQEDHALLAVKASKRMVERLAELNAEWKKQGWKELRIGIGINTGEMIVGHLGGQILLDYTVIGDNVNVSSRLESLNKDLGTTILVAGSTYEMCKDEIEFNFKGEKLVKGKSLKVSVYEVCI